MGKFIAPDQNLAENLDNNRNNFVFLRTSINQIHVPMDPLGYLRSLRAFALRRI